MTFRKYKILPRGIFCYFVFISSTNSTPFLPPLKAAQPRVNGYNALCVFPRHKKTGKKPVVFINGWGGRIRTSAWRYQKPLPYRLATPQHSESIEDVIQLPMQMQDAKIKNLTEFSRFFVDAPKPHIFTTFWPPSCGYSAARYRKPSTCSG